MSFKYRIVEKEGYFKVEFKNAGIFSMISTWENLSGAHLSFESAEAYVMKNIKEDKRDREKPKVIKVYEPK